MKPLPPPDGLSEEFQEVLKYFPTCRMWGTSCGFTNDTGVSFQFDQPLINWIHNFRLKQPSQSYSTVLLYHISLPTVFDCYGETGRILVHPYKGFYFTVKTFTSQQYYKTIEEATQAMKTWLQENDFNYFIHEFSEVS